MNTALEISALGRLIEKGAIRSGVRNEHLIRRFETARWVTLGSRRAEWVLRGEAEEAVVSRLSKLMPDWRDSFEFLRSIGRDPFDSADIEALPMLRRQVDVTAPRINRRNWNAAAGLGPKNSAKASADCVLTKDWVLRFKPNAGFIGIRHDQERVDFYEMARQWTECAIAERAWVTLASIAGTPPKLIVTCENLGAYIDFPLNDEMLVIYSPGADTEAVAALLRKVPTAPWLHFGDIDPEGIEIGKRLAAETGRPLSFLIPSFAEEYLEDAARPVKTPWSIPSDLPIVAKLQDRNRRIFQEVFMLDDRLATDIAERCSQIEKITPPA